MFGAAARYCRAKVGSSHDDAHPDNSEKHTGKIYSSPLHVSRFVLLLLRQRRGAATTTWAPRSDTCEKQRATPRASASAPPDNSALQTDKIDSFPLHSSRVVFLLLRQLKYPRHKTGAAAGNGLGTTLNYLRGAAGNGRAHRSSNFDAQRAPPQAAAWAPR
jgi:hypothetical protein